MMDEIRLTEPEKDQMLDRILRRTPRRRRIPAKAMILAAALLVMVLSAGAVTVARNQGWVRFFSDESELPAVSAAEDGAVSGYGEFPTVSDYTRGLKEFVDFQFQSDPASEGTVLEAAQGGPEDGWTRMQSVLHRYTDPDDPAFVEEQVDSTYQADRLSDLSGVWNVGWDLAFLESHYEAVPESHLASLHRKPDEDQYWNARVMGEYEGNNGQIFNLQYKYEAGRVPSVQYEKTDDPWEYYTTDGVTVSISWHTSDTGNLRFWVTCDLGVSYLSMTGSRMEPEELHTLLDSLHLSGLPC